MDKTKAIRKRKLLHVEIEEELHTMLKMHVVMKGTNMAEFVRGLIKDKLSGSGVRT